MPRLNGGGILGQTTKKGNARVDQMPISLDFGERKLEHTLAQSESA
jgi:hypothetical protein